MSTISFYLLLKVSRFFKYLLQQPLLKTIYRVTFFFYKTEPYTKIPTQHYTAGRSLKQMAIFDWKSTKVSPEFI